MAEKRQLELYLLRFLPHALRDDFVTVGLLLLESDGGFAEVRFTRDWRMLQCVAPDVELEWFEMVESEIRGRLESLRRREDLMQLMSERFGTMIDVAPTKAVLTEDPAKEMEVLTSIYLVPMGRGERAQQRTGRVAIVSTMREAFIEAGVLELMQRDLDVVKYTGQGDPFRIDFGYRVGSAVKMFHAVSVAANVDQALALAYRYSRIDAGMRREQLQASLTAVVDQGMALQEEKTRFAIGMLEQDSVRVRVVGEMAIEMPTVHGHPNRAGFRGVLTMVDVASDKSPSGARGHRVLLTRRAAEAAIPSLLGMALDYSPALDRHDARRKIGVITRAEIVGRVIEVGGFLYAKDFPEIVAEIGRPGSVRGRAGLGMSYEIADALVEDIKASVWVLNRVTFTGAAVLRRDKAAYFSTWIDLG